MLSTTVHVGQLVSGKRKDRDVQSVKEPAVVSDRKEQGHLQQVENASLEMVARSWQMWATELREGVVGQTLAVGGCANGLGTTRHVCHSEDRACFLRGSKRVHV